MNRIFFIIMLPHLLLFGSCGNGQTPSAGEKLNVEAFALKMKELPEARIVDVRTSDEFLKGHVQNAINIDVNGEDFDRAISGLDKLKPVFVYCLSGGRSEAAASRMRKQAFKEVYEMEGGMIKWRAAGLPETVNTTPAAGMTRSQYESIITSEKIVLVDFYADWCAPCKRMKPYLDDIGRTMADRVTLVRINADDNPELCKELGIDALPVLMVCKNGKTTWRNSGYVTKDDVLKQLQ